MSELQEKSEFILWWKKTIIVRCKCRIQRIKSELSDVNLQLQICINKILRKV